jgi:hypothetical protein
MWSFSRPAATKQINAKISTITYGKRLKEIHSFGLRAGMQPCTLRYLIYVLKAALNLVQGLKARQIFDCAEILKNRCVQREAKRVPSGYDMN